MISLGYVMGTEKMFEIKGETSIFEYGFNIKGNVYFRKDIVDVMSTISKNTEGFYQKIYCLDLNRLSIFLEYSLLNKGFTLSKEKNKIRQNEFSTIRNDRGITYSFKVKFNNVLFEFVDVEKILMNKRVDLIKSFGLKDIKTPEFMLDNKNYKSVRSKIANDIVLIEKSISKNGKNKYITGSSQSYNELKKSFEEEHNVKFRSHFPNISNELYSELLDAYKGGVMLHNKDYQNKIVDSFSFDINSSYIKSMTERLPKMLPTKFYGKGDTNKLIIQKFKAVFSVKENGVPFLMNKFRETITHSEMYTYENDIITLSSVDMELFLDNYDVEYIEYLYYYLFEEITNPFNNFVNENYKNKLIGKETNDSVLVLFSKTRLNSCYGKFATKISRKQTVPYITKNGDIDYKTINGSSVAEYLPMAIFISAYSRKELINTVNSFNRNGHKVLYTDTDSIYVEKTKEAIEFANNTMNIHETELGAWKKQKDGLIKVLGKKTYAIKEDGNNYVSIKASGLNVVETIENIEDIYSGMKIECKEYVRVNGGAVEVSVKKSFGKISLEEFIEHFEKGVQECIDNNDFYTMEEIKEMIKE